MKVASVLLAFALLFTTACEKTIMTRGYALDFSDFSKIKVGKDDAQAVFDKVGSPTIRSTIEDEQGCYSWYYAYKRTEKNGFLDPKVLEQKTIVVTFNAKGIVQSVSESKGEKEISVVTEKTATAGKDAGILGETFGGLGKYRKQYEQK